MDSPSDRPSKSMKEREHLKEGVIEGQRERGNDVQRKGFPYDCHIQQNTGRIQHVRTSQEEFVSEQYIWSEWLPTLERPEIIKAIHTITCCLKTRLKGNCMQFLSIHC